MILSPEEQRDMRARMELAGFDTTRQLTVAMSSVTNSNYPSLYLVRHVLNGSAKMSPVFLLVFQIAVGELLLTSRSIPEEEYPVDTVSLWLSESDRRNLRQSLALGLGTHYTRLLEKKGTSSSPP